MDIHTAGWIGVVILLFISSFGVFWCAVILFSILTFSLGLMSLLYVQQGDIDRFYRKCVANPLTIEKVSEGGLNQIVKLLTSPKRKQKTDHRVTGSELIDSSLQEILGYILRDYVTPWYDMISTDPEFTEVTVKRTAQSLAVNISNRVKEIDWIPYLTTRLVDDAASHLRLFKQARARIKMAEKQKSPKHSPHKEQKNSPKKSHKRNKSETDIWYYGNKNVVELRDSEKNIGNSKFYMADEPKRNANSLESNFFDLECQMENNIICRDAVCLEVSNEKEFLSELIEILLYILLPDEDFQCKPLRFILRELIANSIVLPLFIMISDPDYINQVFIWLCLREASLPSEIFLTTLRLTDDCDELKATKELVSKEIQLLRSRDSGGESDLAVKQQLNSLVYVLKLVNNRLSKVDTLKDSGAASSNDYPSLDTLKTIDLPLDVILKNNVALSYFMDFVTGLGKQVLLFFYLNIEGWKISVEQQLSNIQINKMKGVYENVDGVYDNIRTAAFSMYEQYLTEKSEQRIDLNSSLVQMLYFRIKNLDEPPSELWFDDLQNAAYEKLKNEDEFLPAFKKSTAYLKLLEELDLLQHAIAEEDNISLSSMENIDIHIEDTGSPAGSKDDPMPNKQTLKFTHSDSHLMVDTDSKGVKHVRSLSDVTCLVNKDDVRCNEESQRLENGKGDHLRVDSRNALNVEEKNLKRGDFTLAVDITKTGIVSEKGKTFGIYALNVRVQYDTNYIEEWHIYRRYSDFYDLHSKVKDKYPDLSKIAFPGKKTFHNMDRAVLERRMRMLGTYMHELCQRHVIASHPGLQNLLMTFLEQGAYDRATLGGITSNTIDTLVNPLKSGMRTIKNMPEQFINTVDEVVEGLSKVFHAKPGRTQEASKVGASIDVESDDNIPLRIMLLLMDEVFDLKSRNQWLRRRIVTLLRQIVRTMFGDIVNRRILDYVSFITSPKNVAHYLHVFKQSFWPNGMKADKRPDRDHEIKCRTRVAAKAALLSCLSDELKHIIGSETTRRGLLTIFELFQRPVLNRRLLYVLLEGVLCTLFPEKDMLGIFQKLHSKSKRIQNLQKKTP